MVCGREFGIGVGIDIGVGGLGLNFGWVIRWVFLGNLRIFFGFAF